MAASKRNYLLIDVQSQGATAAINQVNQSISSIGPTAQRSTQQAQTGFTKLGITIDNQVKSLTAWRAGASAFFGGIAVSKFVEWTGQLERTTVALTTMTGSAKTAAGMIENVRQLSLKSPFTFGELADQTVLMSAFGFKAQEIHGTLTAIVDAAAAVGGTTQKLQQIALAIGQIQVKGRLNAEEINKQLGEAGIAASKYLAQFLSLQRQRVVSTQEVLKLAEKQRLDAEVGVRAILIGMRAQYGGLAEVLSEQTLIGRLRRLYNEIQLLVQALGTQLKPAIVGVVNPLIEMTSTMRRFLETVQEMAPWIQKLVSFFILLGSALGIFAAVFGRGAAWGAITKLTGLIVAFGKAVFELVRIIRLVVATGAGFLGFFTALSIRLPVVFAIVSKLAWPLAILSTILTGYTAYKWLLEQKADPDSFLGILQRSAQWVQKATAGIKDRISSFFFEVKPQDTEKLRNIINQEILKLRKSAEETYGRLPGTDVESLRNRLQAQYKLIPEGASREEVVRAAQATANAVLQITRDRQEMTRKLEKENTEAILADQQAAIAKLDQTLKQTLTGRARIMAEYRPEFDKSQSALAREHRQLAMNLELQAEVHRQAEEDLQTAREKQQQLERLHEYEEQYWEDHSRRIFEAKRAEADLQRARNDAAQQNLEFLRTRDVALLERREAARLAPYEQDIFIRQRQTVQQQISEERLQIEMRFIDEQLRLQKEQLDREYQMDLESIQRTKQKELEEAIDKYRKIQQIYTEHLIAMEGKRLRNLPFDEQMKSKDPRENARAVLEERARRQQQLQDYAADQRRKDLLDAQEQAARLQTQFDLDAQRKTKQRTQEYTQDVMAREVAANNARAEADDTYFKERMNREMELSRWVRDQYQKTFDSIKNIAGEVFDALFDRSKSLFESIADIFKRTMLNVLKEIVTSQVAAAFMTMMGTPTTIYRGQGAGPGGTPIWQRIGGIFGGGGQQQQGNIATPPFSVQNFLQRFANPFGPSGAPGGPPGGSSLDAFSNWQRAQSAMNLYGLPAGVSPGTAAAGGSGKLGMLAGLLGISPGFLFNSGSISLGAGSATTAAGIGGMGGALAGIATSPAALLGGALLAAYGVKRGGKLGAGMSVGGGALAGAAFGTLIMPGLGTIAGAAIGAGIGGVASLIRSFHKSAEQKAVAEVQQVYGVQIRDKQFLATIVELGKQMGGLRIAVRSPQVAEMVKLYGMMTGQEASNQPQQMYATTLAQQGGQIYNMPLYEGGRPVSPYVGATINTTPSVYVQLEPQQAEALMTGQVVKVIDRNPEAVSNANTAATRNGINRSAGRAASWEPLTTVA